MSFKCISAAICLIVFLIVYSGSFLFVESVENSLLDYQFRLRGRSDAESSIVIAGIDQETLHWAARPTFAWGPLYAEFINALTTASASVLVIDLIFSPGSEKSIRDHVTEIAGKFELKLPRIFFNHLGFDKPFRESLLKMVKAGTVFITGFAWEKNQPAFSDNFLFHIAGSKNTGYFNLSTSTDGVNRNVRLFADDERGGTAYAVSSIAALRASKNDRILPTEPFQLVNYRGSRGTFKTIQLKRIIEDSRSGKELAAELKNKIVILGFIDINDYKSTPFGYMPGPEVHANIIDNIINQRFMRTVSKKVEAGVLILVMVLLFLLSHFRKNAAIASAVIGLLSLFVSAFLFFDPYVMPLFKPSVILLAFIICESMLAYRAVFLDRKRVKQVFSRYVSDSVVNEILASNDRDFLKGRRRSLCILIADIRGFTTFSEKYDAHFVVNLLNAYFSRLTEIIMRNRGVVDKFLGDGLLAFFNAPVETERYADHALNAALEIVRYTSSDEFKALCPGENLRVGIAVHCGETVFGNIGSDRKAEFTVIGDVVNACSRMESLNKDFSTSLIISSEVKKLLSADYDLKLLGKRSLRGKSEEIELFTISVPEEK